MRVISGNYRNRRLKSLEGQNTRPTTDKIKESMFNMIGPYFDGEMVLDLFAGSGALGIEAVSRGAKSAYLIDHHFQAIRVIKENVQITKEAEKFNVLKMDATLALNKLAQENVKFDLVFLDPPYRLQEIEEQIAKLEELSLVNDKADIICETSADVVFSDTIGNFTQTKRKVYGITAVTIFRYGLESRDV